MKTRWFGFHQNNSFGRWKEPAITLWVEARDAEHANARAQMNGVYFDGCEDGRDCDCCGDRWCRAWGEGEETPDTEGVYEHSMYKRWAVEAGIPEVKMLPIREGTKQK